MASPPQETRRPGALLSAVALLTLVSSWCACSRTHAPENSNAPRVIVLGIDGMDPSILERMIAAGNMPNFARLAALNGGVKRLGTSTPPQSPVAWSNLITGLNAGGHGIFDFIHRDPMTMELYLSTSRVEPPAHVMHAGHWILPLSAGRTTLLRQGKAFWEYLDEAGVPALVYRIPSNFPPVPTRGRTLSGMGTPDVLGTYGTFSFYTDDAFAASGAVSGGHVYPVEVKDGIVQTAIYGPYNTFRKGEPQSSLPLRVAVDSRAEAADFQLSGREFVLRQGEWSPWIEVRFDLLPHLASVKGICRFFLKQVTPTFQLYVSPVNMAPDEPALPISTPEKFSHALWEELGDFYTQGIAEDTKALSGGFLDDAEFLAQSRSVLEEQVRAYRAELARYRAGLFFFYFSSLDLNSHMFWRATDQDSPTYTAEVAEKFGDTLAGLYRQMDGVLGQALEKAGEDATVIVVSDHGFAPYHRSFNLNAWLHEHGYLALAPGHSTGGNSFEGVDWAQTRAYGLGLNGLYLNLRGREAHGSVDPAGADALRHDLARALLDVTDPVGGEPAITRVDLAADVYSGPHVKDAPDLVIGYNRGYRAGWGTVLGAVPGSVFEDNLDPWSGDHCMDPRMVPGVLLSNRQIVVDAAALTDIAPTLLALYGIAQPEQMKGKPVLSAPAGNQGAGQR